MRKHRSLGIIVSMTMALTMLGAASGPAAAVTRFGAKLDTNTQPSNCCPPHTCAEIGGCTWVMNTAHNRASAKAPMDGTIHRVRVIAGQPGFFRLFLARVNNSTNPPRSRLIFRGPRIDFVGQPDPDPDPTHYVIETFNVNFQVHRGDSIAVRAPSMTALRCNSGGPKTLQYQPPLVVGGPLQVPDDTDGCNMLIELQY